MLLTPMKTLSALLEDTKTLEIIGNKESLINAIHFDSKSVQNQSLFVAYDGVSQDGHNFIEDAITRGAIVIVHEKEILNKNTGIAYVRVKDGRKALATIAQSFYSHPSKRLKLVGVTGTDGKTTTATLLFKLFSALGYPSALMSTIENKISDETFPASHTTPDPVGLASFLDQAANKGSKYAFIECSSHAIDQQRIWGLEFALIIFTNLTHEHLDYHKTIEEYALVKKTLFDSMRVNSFAVANGDDQWAEYMLSETKAEKHFFSLKDKKVTQSLEGIAVSWNGKKIISKLIGTFNSYNILGIYTAAILLGMDEQKTIKEIAKLNPPPGRMEFIWSKDGICGVIDYAHTPNALDNVLRTLRSVMPRKSRIITVTGCTGERDPSKRPIMGKIAYELSDYTVFSSDDPRSEDPLAILKEVTMDLPALSDKFECESDRVKALAKAVSLAKPGDVVLLAGKGHETSQILSTGKIHFSDKEELQKLFNERR